MQSLTPLQQQLIDRLSFLALEELAERARTAWANGVPYPYLLTPAERATLEGASLCEHFKLANRQVGEA